MLESNQYRQKILECGPVKVTNTIGLINNITGLKASWCIVDDVTCAPKDCSKLPWKHKQEEENSMTEKTEAAAQRDYLNGRLREVTWAKEKALEDAYNMHVDPRPKNYKDLIDAIKNDKFTLDTKRTKKIDSMIESDLTFGIFGCFDGILFHGGPDDAGYEAAFKDMEVKRRATKDIIMSGVYADGLKALQDFEAWMPA